MTHKIIPAEPKHVGQIYTLERKSFPTNSTSRHSLRRFVKIGSIYVIVKRNRVIGECIALTRKDTTSVRIHTLAVARDHQGQGIGKAFLEFVPTLADNLTEIRLEVRADNDYAIEFYERQGFKKYGILKQYYDDGVDALKLKKELNGGQKKPAPIILS